MTRSESRHWKMELLRYVSEDIQAGHRLRDGPRRFGAVLHYFEGMLSLGPYRVPDAGRGYAAHLDRSAASASRSSSSATLSAAACGNWSITIASSRSGIGATTTTSCRALGQARSLQRAVRHAADVHVQPRVLGGRIARALWQSYRATAPSRGPRREGRDDRPPVPDPDRVGAVRPRLPMASRSR